MKLLSNLWTKLFPDNTSARPVVLPPEQVVVFTPKHDFFSQEFRSQYLRGSFYTARASNKRLCCAVFKWHVQQKIDIVSGGSRLSGKGIVE